MKTVLIARLLLPVLLSLAAIVAALLVLPQVEPASAQLDVTNLNTLSLSGKLRLQPQTLTVTGSFIITPTRSNIVLASSLAVTSSTTAPITTTGARAGDLIIVRNSNITDAIVIDGAGGTVECGADLSLGPGDIVTFIYDGAGDWRCQSLRDN